MPKTENKPAFLKGFLWFTFSGTAMASAFLLPVHIFATMSGYTLHDGFFLSGYLFILFLCGLYHSFYRVKTIAFDLGLRRLEKILDVVLPIIFLVALGILAWLLFLASSN